MKRFLLLMILAVGLTSLNLGGPAGCGNGTPAPAAAQCGNGVLETGELCDGGALNGEDCESQGFSPEGTLACASDCGNFDTSGCVASGTVSGLVSISGDKDDYFSAFQLLPDSLGNIYAGGIISSSATLTVGDKSIAGLGGVRHSFAAKINADGSVAWLNGFQGNGTSDDNGGYLVLGAGDAVGDVYFQGSFYGNTLQAPGQTVANIDLTGTTPDSYGGRLKPDGSVDWLDPFASTDSEQMYFFSEPVSGNLYVSGFFNGPTLTLGSKILTNGGSTDIFIARIDPANGSFLWVTQFSSNDYDDAFPFFGPEGNLYVSGRFVGTNLAVNGVNALANTAASSMDAYVARLDPDTGALSWITGFGSNLNEFINGQNRRTDPSGNIFVTGQFNGPTLTAGTKTITNVGAATQDIFAARIDPANGSVVWLSDLGSTMNDTPSLAVAEDGNVYVGGGFYGSSLASGGKTVSNADASGTTSDGFVAKLDPADGSTLWLAGFADLGNQYTSPVVTSESSGALYVNSGYSGTTLTVAGQTLTNGDPSGTTFDSYLAKFDPDGTLLWLAGFPGADQDSAYLTTDVLGRLPSDRLYLQGSFRGSAFSLGGETFTNADSGGTTDDAFVGRLDPSDGSVLWVLPVQSDKNDSAFLVPDQAGRLYLGGNFKGTSVTVQGQTLTNADPSGTTNDAFVGRIAP